VNSFAEKAPHLWGFFVFPFVPRESFPVKLKSD
jgi:hypothetical protein